MSHDETTPNGPDDLPEGVIDADAAGGWESGAVADEETSERSEDAATGYDAEAVGDIETAEVSEGIDPDMSTREEPDTSSRDGGAQP
ncbi:hypothetical protein [Microbacterium lacticum]